MEKRAKILSPLLVLLALALFALPSRRADGQKVEGAKAPAEVKEELTIEDIDIPGPAKTPAKETPKAVDAVPAVPVPAADAPKAAEAAPVTAPAAEAPAAVPAVVPAVVPAAAPAADAPKAADAVPAAAPAAEVPVAVPAAVPPAEIPKAVAEVPVAPKPADEPKAAEVAPAPAPAAEAPKPVAVEAPKVDGAGLDKLAEDLLAEKPVAKPAVAPATGAAPIAKPAEPAPAVEAPKPAAEAPKPAVEAPAAAPVAAPAAEAPKPAVEAPVAAPVAAPAAEAPKAGGEAAIAPVAVVPPAAEEPKVADAPPEVGLMKDSEELRRRAYERHAKESLEEGDKAFIGQKYQVATKYYQEAVNAFKEAGFRSDNERDRLRAVNGLRDSIYMEAVDLMNQGDYENAQKRARNALLQGHKLAGELLAEIKYKVDFKPPPPKVMPKQRWKEESFQKKEEELATKLTHARELYLSGELEDAQLELDHIMKRDPNNTEAMRLMEKVARRKGDLATMELEYTRRTMVADVRKTWNRRDYGIDERPKETSPTSTPKTPPADSRTKEILDKMSKIEIPEIDFRQANIHDVINFLQSASVEHDPDGERAKKRGVSIILHLGQTGAGAGAGAGGAAAGKAGGAADPFAAAAADAGGAAGGGGDVPLITFSARYITLLESLRLVTQIGNLKWRVEGSVVMVVPFNAPDGDIIHRSYDVMASFVDVTKKAKEELDASRSEGELKKLTDAGSGGEKMDLKELFKEMGVKWPEGSFIKFVPSIGKLMVANTINNLTLFEEKLSMLNVVPNQIEIEARFVEVRQTDLSSLGFEYGLTDDWEMMHRTDIVAPLAGTPRVQMEQNYPGGGFSKGNRFLRTKTGGDPVSDDVMRISSVLTNPELTIILHAIQQKGNADLLSAPKVTTQAGQEATIKVVTEYIYPTEFNVEPITATAAGGAGNAQIVGGIVEPGSFETREVGVILSVMPQVTPEGQMIILTMAPEVVSEPIWKNYGSVYTDPNGNEQRLNMEQPFFHTRSITTQIAIYNGATVVMGGMINELRNEVDDKIPLLGDIPLLGRLFRSRYDDSEKRNLLIFVTARLVDPAGRTLKRRDDTMKQPPDDKGKTPAPGAKE